MTPTPQAPTGWEIRGGAGGARARWDDLQAYARIVSTAAERVESAAARILVLSRWTIDEFAQRIGPPGSMSAAFGPIGPVSAEQVMAQRARERLREIASGPDGLTVASRRLGDLAGHLRRTARAYLAADHAAAATFDALVWSAGAMTGAIAGRTLLPFAAAALLAGPVTAVPRPRLVHGLTALAPGFASGLSWGFVPVVPAAPLLPGAGRPRDLRQLAALVTRLGALSAQLREPQAITLTTRQVPVRRGRAPRAPAGVGDLMRVLALTYHDSGVIRVQQVTGADGRRAWIVAIPGVQTWAATPGRNPFDLTSAVRTMAGRRSAPALAVTGALEAVGAGRDEPVLLAGHSLGGMVAGGLAADPAFRDRFRVTHVVTAGSPVALSRVPPSVRVLSVEHEEDVVPALDGRDNPDRATWVSVRGAALDDPAIRAAAVGDPYIGHDIAAYERTADRLDRFGPALLDGWSEGFDRFAAPRGAVRVWEFRAER